MEYILLGVHNNDKIVITTDSAESGRLYLGPNGVLWDLRGPEARNGQNKNSAEMGGIPPRTPL